MKRTVKRLAALSLAAILLLGGVPARAAETDVLTRGEGAELLLEAGDEYTPGLERSDILKGYWDGGLELDAPLTRVQALVMLERAFGGLPKPVGDNARTGYPAAVFTDVPSWAEGELESVLAAGIVDGSGGLLRPNEPITEEELNTLVRRVYALEGSCVRDDFYAAAGKQWLDSSEIPAGRSTFGAGLSGVDATVDRQLAELMEDICANPQKRGSPKAAIKAVYECAMDLEGREKAGIAPIQSYLDDIGNARTLDELMAVELRMQEEIGVSTLMKFGVAVDPADSQRNLVTFETFMPVMDKDFYANGDQAQTEAYMTYLRTLFTLSGLGEEEAGPTAESVFAAEKPLSAVRLTPQEIYDVDKTYNIYTMDQLRALFPNVELDKVFAAAGLESTDSVKVTEAKEMEAAAKLFDAAHLDTLKALSRFHLLKSVDNTLSRGFRDAEFALSKAVYGTDSPRSDEDAAADQVKERLEDYLGQAYAEAYFSPEAKADVLDLCRELTDVYRERLQKVDWLSDATKEMALRKLDAMKFKAGYPDSWDSCLDDVEIKSPGEGGSLFSNAAAIRVAKQAAANAGQNEPVDKTKWGLKT